MELITKLSTWSLNLLTLGEAARQYKRVHVLEVQNERLQKINARLRFKTSHCTCGACDLEPPEKVSPAQIKLPLAYDGDC